MHNFKEWSVLYIKSRFRNVPRPNFPFYWGRAGACVFPAGLGANHAGLTQTAGTAARRSGQVVWPCPLAKARHLPRRRAAGRGICAGKSSRRPSFTRPRCQRWAMNVYTSYSSGLCLVLSHITLIVNYGIKQTQFIKSTSEPRTSDPKESNEVFDRAIRVWLL